MEKSKSPISILQEYAMKFNIGLPQYTWNFDNSKFICICEFNGKRSVGQAGSKKNAKEISAEDMLQRIDMSIMQCNLNTSFSSSISTLHEYCQAENIAMPKFSDEGLNNNKFVVNCCVNGVNTEGIGTTKKEAKKDACDKALLFLGVSMSNLCISKKAEKCTKKSKVVNNNNKINDLSDFSEAPSRCSTPETDKSGVDLKLTTPEVDPEYLRELEAKVKELNINYEINEAVAGILKVTCTDRAGIENSFFHLVFNEDSSTSLVRILNTILEKYD